MVYKTHGTCSREIVFHISPEHIIEDVEFIGGCSGNTQGVARLVTGMKAEEAVARLKGIRCGSKPTSCPDQLARALEAALRDTKKTRGKGSVSENAHKG